MEPSTPGNGADILTAFYPSCQPLHPLSRTTRKAKSPERARVAMARTRRKHFALIIHGARADREDVRHLIDWVRAKGHSLLPRVTRLPGDPTPRAAAPS